MNELSNPKDCEITEEISRKFEMEFNKGRIDLEGKVNKIVGVGKGTNSEAKLEEFRIERKKRKANQRNDLSQVDILDLLNS